MIKYSLNCGDCTNTFEGWFPDSKDFSKQKKTGQLLCPFCDSGNVDKAIMAPNIQKKQTQKKTVSSTNSVDYSSKDIMMAGQAKAVLRRINKYVEKNFENVGKKFYKEVKKSQAGKRDEKFYGTPSDEEVSKLLDEGVDLFHVPKVKDN
jgi:hypothetical protein|tara:strand:- start:203 stop:649 length:447 start_codon:yes stop_codon:yes gene_type:complete